MNIERIELTNYGSWESLDLPIEPGVTLISGANGAGKSTILSAAEFALFGATSDAGRLIRRGTDEARVSVHLDGGITVTRRVRLSGQSAKVTLSLHRNSPHDDNPMLETYENISAATTTESQAILDGILGVTRETLRASALSMQGDGAAFCEAKPADRKRVLMAALPSMELWPMLHDTAKAEKRAADDAVAAATTTLTMLLDPGGRSAGERHIAAVSHLADALNERDNAEATEQAAERLVAERAAEAEAAREARRQHAAAVEAEQRARADHERAGVERQAADDALARAKAAAANAPSVEVAELTEHAASVALVDAKTAYDSAVRDATRYAEQLAEARREVAAAEQIRNRAGAELVRLAARLSEARGNTCPECHQDLVTPEARAIVTRLDEEEAAAAQAVNSAGEAFATWRARLTMLEGETRHELDDVEGENLRLAQQDRQDAATALAEAQTIQSLAGSIDAAQQRARGAMDRQAETARAYGLATKATLDAGVGPYLEVNIEDRHQAALAALATARAAHSTAAAELARAEEAAKLAERQAAEETAARERLEVAAREAAVAKVLCDGFGPAGCPAMIVDSVLGDLADEANRVLAELSSPIRVDLRSQRVTQKGDVVDALEIVVSMNAMEASYETLSGGERTRVALALRAALTRLLASKRGARVRLLVVDEPQGLDASGSEAFADVLGEFVRAGIFESCIVVTHDDRLADRIDRVIRVEKDSAGVSRLVGAAVEVAA